MEILRTAANPWGQQILVGVAWDLIWAALFAGVIFAVGHAIYLKALAPTRPGGPPEGSPVPPGASPPSAASDRVERHSRSSRGFHWLMAISMFTLLITAFFPLVGIRFAWVTIHWIAGVALTLLIAYHIVYALAKQDRRAVWIGKKERREVREAVGKFFRREPAKAARSAKYPLDQRAYHNAATIAALGAIVTGLLMMFRIDTWFWASNPYFLSDSTWGLVYVLHGLCAVGLITLVVAHVYFAIRPEKRWMTRSMIKGWITREEYLAHYDPELWALEEGQIAVEAGVGGGPDAGGSDAGGPDAGGPAGSSGSGHSEAVAPA